MRDAHAKELTVDAIMNLRTEIHSGDASWQEAEPLLKEVWPPAVMATRDWRDVVFAHADKRILVWDANDGLVCHAGLFFRTMMWNDQSVRVGGVGGVATARCYRGRGIASEALRLAASTFAEADLDFGLLFCERDTFEYYARLGWIEFDGQAAIEQPTGGVSLTSLTPFILDLKQSPRSGTLDLCGLPW